MIDRARVSGEVRRDYGDPQRPVLQRLDVALAVVEDVVRERSDADVHLLERERELGDRGPRVHADPRLEVEQLDRHLVIVQPSSYEVKIHVREFLHQPHERRDELFNVRNVAGAAEVSDRELIPVREIAQPRLISLVPLVNVEQVRDDHLGRSRTAPSDRQPQRLR